VRRAALAAFVAATIVALPGTAAAQTAQDEPIPLTPIDGLTSLDATVTIDATGTMEGEPTQGDLIATLSSNDQGESRIEVTGSLVRDVIVQVGGNAVKLLRPDRLSVYRVPEGTYVVVSGFFDTCFKPEDPAATAGLDQLSPQALMGLLTGSDVARGTFVGEESLGDVPVRHYVIDGETFLAAAKASADATVSAFASALRSASDADLYVASDGGYPVAYRGGFSGWFEPLMFDGDTTVQIDLTGINTDTDVTLPSACDHPISR
jgi:hypothetical protein